MKSMVTLFSLAIAGALPFAAQSQTSRFSVGLVTSVDAYLHHEHKSTYYSLQNTIRGSAGMGVNLQIGNRLAAKAGVLYSDKGYSRRLLNQNSGEYELAIYRAKEVRYRADYLDVPVLLGVKVLEKNKISVVPAIGAVNSFFLKGSSTAIFDNGLTFKTDRNLSDYDVWAVAEVSVLYRLSDRVQLSLAPYYRHGIYRHGQTDRSGFSDTKAIGTSLDVRYCF